MRGDWAALAQAVSFVGKPGDPHQLLLDVLGLHPASVEFHQRYAESLDDLFNRAKLQGFGAQLLQSIQRARRCRRAGAGSCSRRLGYAGDGRAGRPRRSSSSRARSGSTARSSTTGRCRRRPDPRLHDRRPQLHRVAGRRARGSRSRTCARSAASRRPAARRAALPAAAPRAAARLLGRRPAAALDGGVLDAAAVALARARARVRPRRRRARRRREPLRAALQHATRASRATRDLTVAEHIARNCSARTEHRARSPTSSRRSSCCEDVPTARLERCLAEHVDTASYRLDAWLLGLVHLQLAAMRYRARRDGRRRRSTRRHPPRRVRLARGPAAQGGAAASAVRARATSSADGLRRRRRAAACATRPTAATSTRRRSTTRPPPRCCAPATSPTRRRRRPDALAVNLSSARVRAALGLIEGIRNGQPLGALLGYRLQRGLHDRHAPLELDRFIHRAAQGVPARRRPAGVDPDADGVPIEAIEARNVVDGLKLVEHVAPAGQRRAIRSGCRCRRRRRPSAPRSTPRSTRLLDVHDALADLALAEGVHQAVLGNYDRAAATLDATRRARFPPEPEVVRTPRSGIALTHRVGDPLRAGVDPDARRSPACR